MSKSNSPSDVSQAEGPKYRCPYPSCEKIYKLEGAMRNHLKNVHGEEESSLSETKFDPQETSTSNLVENERKRKRPLQVSESDTDDDEGLEDALRAKESRRDYLERLNQQRDCELGFDIGVEDSIIGPQTDTQTLVRNLEEAVQLADNPNVSASVLAMSGNDSMELGINNNVVLKNLEDKIKILEGVIHDKDTRILDMEVVQREHNEMLDEKDKKLKELRKVVKLKQEEISELLRDKEMSNIRLKSSPVKEVLKQEVEKARRHIENQTNRIRNLENQNDELSKQVKFLEKDQPDIIKLQRSVKENLDRAEHYSREREDLYNTIASLKKKIPCFNMATCDLGKRCQFSHVLKYSSQLNTQKNIPCVHFIDNRCKFSAEDCKFSHDEKYLSGKQRRQYLENRYLEDISEEEEEEFYCQDNRGAKYAARADKSRPPSSKKRKTTFSSDRSESSLASSSYNTDATRYFPEPVPAISRRRSSTNTNSPGSSGARKGKIDAGNDYGARTARSSLVSPSSRRGSRQRGGRGSSGSRTRMTSPRSRSNYRRSTPPRSPRQPKTARGRSKDGSRRHAPRR